MMYITKDYGIHTRERRRGTQKLSPAFFALLLIFCVARKAQAQEVASAAPASHAVSAALPDAPEPAAQPFPRIPVPASNMSAREKLRYASENAFGIPSIVFAAAGAGVNQAQDLSPEFRQGAEGYGRYIWHSYSDQAVDSYFVDFFLPEAFHTDPRYHPLRFGGAWARMKCVGASLVLTHTDSGKVTFNTPQVLGSGMAASVSSLYYPERDRTASLVMQRWASNLAGDGLMMVLREFTPEIISAGKHACVGLSFGVPLCKNSKSTHFY
jgi:hypothetical protein